MCPGDSVADVAFVVDEGVSREKANYITEFLENTVQSLEVHRECIRIALVAYSTEPQIISFLNTSTDKAEILQEIQTFSPRKGKANLGAAINLTRRRIFAERTGSRKAQAVEQIATIITHRPSDDNVSEVATLLRRTGVTVFAIGLEDANYTQLNQIASYPPNQNVIKLVKFSELPSQNETFQKKLFNQIHNKLYVQSESGKQLRTGKYFAAVQEELSLFKSLGFVSGLLMFSWADTGFYMIVLFNSALADENNSWDCKTVKLWSYVWSWNIFKFL